MKIDYRDTLANIFFDGLSASESFFMEALLSPVVSPACSSAAQPVASWIFEDPAA